MITETAGYFWSRSFCKVSVEVAHASRGRRDRRGPGKEELEESTSQLRLPLENIKEVLSLLQFHLQERGMRGVRSYDT